MGPRFLVSYSSEEFNRFIAGVDSHGVFTTLGSRKLPAQSRESRSRGFNSEAAYFRFPRHLDRVFNDARERGVISLSQPEFEEGISRELRGALVKTPYELLTGEVPSILKIVILSNTIGLLIAPFVSSWREGESIELLPFRAERNWPAIKSTDTATSLAARKAAKEAGKHEALLVDRDGYVREGAWSNFFWYSKDGVLKTISNKVLPGIIRSALIEWEAVSQTEITLEDLRAEISEAFITQSTALLTPVRALGGTLFTETERTQALIAKTYPRIVNESKSIFEL